MNFQVGQEFELVVSEVYTPTRFYFQLRHDLDQLEILMDSMHSFYTEHPEVDLLVIPVELVRVGQNVAVIWEEDGLWHRGMVRRVMSVKQVEVEYLDYGSRTVMDKSALYQLMPQFGELGRQAHLAAVHDIHPLQKKWSKRNSSRFSILVGATVEEVEEEDVTKREVRPIAKVKDVVKKKIKLQLICDDINIGDKLVHEEHAQYAVEEVIEVPKVEVTANILVGERTNVRQVSQTESLLECLSNLVPEMQKPLPQHLKLELVDLKTKIINLSMRIADSNEEGLDDLAKEQKVIVNKIIGVSMSSILRNRLSVEDDTQEEDSDESDSGVGSLHPSDALSQSDDVYESLDAFLHSVKQ